MQLKNTTFIQRHIEKIALGSAGLFLLLVAFYYLLNIPARPFGISVGDAKKGETMNISAAPEVMKKKADALAQRLSQGKAPKNYSPVDPADYPPTDYPGVLSRLHAMPVSAGARLLLAGALPVDPKDFTIELPPADPYYLPLPPVATAPKAVTGNVVLVGGEDRAYVSVEASFNLEAWMAALATPPKSQDKLAQLSLLMAKRAQAISGVYLEREEWMGNKWGNRRRIVGEGQACYLPDQAGPDGNAEPDKAAAIIRAILDNQPAIQRPPFPALDSDSPTPILRDLPKPVVVDGGFGAIGPHTPAEKPERVQPLHIWGHDLTVETGRKYRYRVVACTLNPLYGILAKDLSEDQAKENATRVSLAPAAAQIEKHSAWVEREVPATSHCFLVDSPNAKKASFEIWKVVRGSWVHASFEIKVGDAVGNRQAEVKLSDGSSGTMNMDIQRMLVDILDAVNPATGAKTRAVILMGPDGRLETHYLDQDSESQERRNLMGSGSGSGGGDPVRRR